MQIPAKTPDKGSVPAKLGKRTLWRRLGGRSLSISLVLHGAILAIGIVWVVSIIPAPPEKKVDFMPSGGGGGSPAASEVKNRKRSMSFQSNAPRMAAVGAESKFALPEPDISSEMTSLGALGGGGLSAGLGGNGSGGGRGNGTGKGFGDGMGPGLGGGGGMMNPFGMVDPNANALVGTFHDTKQTRERKPTGVGQEEFLKIVSDFVKRGWNERSLEKFYRAPRKVYTSRIYIPKMMADAAPAAFQCGSEVQPSRWLVVYRGTVTPPKTARYRFVGCADDILAVRFNGKVVFDGGMFSARLGIQMHGRTSSVLTGKLEDRNLEKELRPFFKLPVETYVYPTAEGYNSLMGGCLAGEEFEARQGSSYPIEILLGEVPGGSFGAALMIQEVGERSGGTASGAPALPLFRLDGGTPSPTDDHTYAPPYDQQGPVWKVTGGSGGSSI